MGTKKKGYTYVRPEAAILITCHRLSILGRVMVNTNTTKNAVTSCSWTNKSVSAISVWQSPSYPNKFTDLRAAHNQYSGPAWSWFCSKDKTELKIYLTCSCFLSLTKNFFLYFCLPERIFPPCSCWRGSLTPAQVMCIFHHEILIRKNLSIASGPPPAHLSQSLDNDVSAASSSLNVNFLIFPCSLLSGHMI